MVVHAVLAGHPGVNVGMAAVEYALSSVATEAGIQVVPTRHPALLRRGEELSGAGETGRRMDTGLGPSLPLDEVAPDKVGRLLFWGDFHHMKPYIDEVAAIGDEDLESTLALVMPGAAAFPATIVQSFGSTLLFDSARDLQPGPYRTALSAFLDRCADVWMRDPISAALARRLSQRENVRLGVDPALLLQAPHQRSGDDFVGVFLGRTPAAHRALLQVTEAVCRHLKSRVAWLDWGCSCAFPYLAGREVRFPLGAKDEPGAPANEVLEQLSRARAVVTDAYHLAIIAWSWGIPAITISSAADPVTRSSVDGGRPSSWRDKREVVASQYSALEFLLHPWEWSDPHVLGSGIARVRDALDDGLVMDVQQAMAADARQARLELLSTFDRSVDAPVPRQQLRIGSTQQAVRAAAIVSIRNEIPHIDGLVRHLVLQGLDVVAIDHESTDGSRERLDAWRGRGLLWVEPEPFWGEFNLEAILTRKRELAERLDHDWLLHVDADEWLQPASSAERLIDLLTRADRNGDTVVEFEEFTFVPDVELQPGEDPRERFCTYYFYSRSNYRLMRAWRRDAGLSNIEVAGHILYGHDVRLHREKGLLRHYPMLSPEHGASKYLARTFAPGELLRGWHHDRVGIQTSDFELPAGPALRRLPCWNSRAFDRSCPVSEPHWRWQLAPQATPS